MFVFYIKLQTFKHAITIKIYKFIQIKYTNSLNFNQLSRESFNHIKYENLYNKKSGNAFFDIQSLGVLILNSILNFFNLFFFNYKSHSIHAIV